VTSREEEPRREEPGTAGSKKGDMEDYGKNILSIAPIQMTNESVAGIGIHYERLVDKAACSLSTYR